MAVTYGFYNSLNKDRMYNAEQMSSIFNGIITDGVFSTVGDALMTVAGTGMQVIVKPGRAWFNSTWTLNDAQLPLDVPAADVSLTRIDAVILEVNSAVATRANSIKVLKGTPSANPAKPALSATETNHQYALAYITVGAGATSVTAANIEINVGKTSCPFITSVLQQTNIDDLFNQWNAEFTTWFENVQAQLSGDIAANLQRQIDLLKVATGSKITDDTAATIGVAQDTTVDAAINTIGISVKLLKDESGYITLTVKDSSGVPIAGIEFSNIKDASGNSVVTNENGIASGYIKKGSQTIAIQGYVDIVDYSETIDIVPGNIYTKEITVTDAAAEVLYEESKTVRFSNRVSQFDVCAVGGGGGGGSGRFSNNSYSGFSGGGGGGGNVVNLLDNICNKSSKLILVIGSGGKGGAYRQSYGNGYNGANGGMTSVEYNGSVIVSATGGAYGFGGNIESGLGGSGNGAGGNGVKCDTDTINVGVSGSVHKYNDNSLPLAGGGGGTGGSGYSKWSSEEFAKPFGGKAGAKIPSASHDNYSYSGGDGQGLGGGGAGGNMSPKSGDASGAGGDGYHGGVYIRWRKKS